MEGTIIFGLILITALVGFLLSANFFLDTRRKAKELEGILPSQLFESAKHSDRMFWEVVSGFVVKIFFWLHLFIGMPFAIYFAFRYQLGMQELAVAMAVLVGVSWVFNVIFEAQSSRKIEKMKKDNTPIKVPNDWFYWLVVALVNIPRVYPLYLLFCLLKR